MRGLSTHCHLVCVLAGIALSFASARSADAQGNGSRGVELDTQPDARSTPSPAVGSSAMTDARSAQTREAHLKTSTTTVMSVEAQRLFDEHRWAEAAPLLHRVYTAPGFPAQRDLAQYQLGIALYHLKLHQIAFGVFSSIADMPLHRKHRETLLWLERLATVLPEGADVTEVIGRYDAVAIEALGSFPLPSGLRQRVGVSRVAIDPRKSNEMSDTQEVQSHLYYLLGRYKYRSRQYEDAISLFRKVASGSAYFTKAQFITGISYVQLRQPVPAVQSFKRIVHEIDSRSSAPSSSSATTLDAEDSRMRDLAFLSAARTFYSAALRSSADSYSAIDDVKLGVALKYWDRVDAGGEYGLDALFEQSWAYTMLGDYTHALGNIHTLDAPFFPRSYYPEAEILKAGIYLATCHLSDAETLIARFKQKYQPVRTELKKLVMRLVGDEAVGEVARADGSVDEAAYALLKEVRDGKSNLPLTVRSVAELTLSDRELLRHVQYVQSIDSEQKRLASLSLKLDAPQLVDFGRDSLQLSRDLGVRLTTQLARDRTQERLNELEEHLRTSTWMLVEIDEQRRGRTITNGRGPLGHPARAPREAKDTAVQADDDHVVWPFTGEYWRDELGLYQQSITTKCP